MGACDIAGCVGALHWLSYEPEPGTGSFGVGIAVALLFGAAAAAAVLAERVNVVSQALAEVVAAQVAADGP